MKKLIIVLAGAAVLSGAGAASAQPYQGHAAERSAYAAGWYGGRGWTDERGQWVNINRRQAQLERRIEQGVRSGRLTRPEANRLWREFDALQRLEQRYRVNGLSMREREELDARFDRLAARIRWEARDGDRDYRR